MLVTKMLLFTLETPNMVNWVFGGFPKGKKITAAVL